MKETENLKIGLNELRSNKMRTILTMLGIIFGVGAVIAMLSIGEGARQEALEQIKLLGTNNIIINAKLAGPQPKGSEAAFSPGLTIKDAESIWEINPYVEYITASRHRDEQVFYGSHIVTANINGTSPEYINTYNTSLAEGVFFTHGHNTNYNNVCVIGSGVKEGLFKYTEALGKEIKVGDLWFRVIGVMARKNVSSSGNESMGIRDFNNDIYIPFGTMVNKFDYEEVQGGWWENRDKVTVVDRSSIDRITVKIKEGLSLEESAALINRILERRHNGVDDFEVVVPEALIEQQQKTQRIFNVVMGAIAGISLLVGGIGIMNIMLANILERTKEIGIRRALGATRQNVLNQFIYEALVISIAGGLLGIAAGFILTSLITTYAEWRTIITPFSVILAFVVSACVGLIFGIYPAKKAADKDPIESLRYE